MVSETGNRFIRTKFYDLQRDYREVYTASTAVGTWGGAESVRVIQRHLATKMKDPDIDTGCGMPNEGIENLRPETQASVKAFLIKDQSLLQKPE